MKTLLILFLSFQLSAQEYCSKYQEACSNTLNYFLKIKPKIEAELQHYQLDIDEKELFSVLAPEISHYNFVLDKVETFVVEIFYGELGGTYADFSIGSCQLKPSFIEKLEVEILAHKKLNHLKDIAIFPFQDSVEIRKERLKRIKNSSWQIRYVIALQQISTFQNPQIKKYNSEERVRYLATAFNSGFWLDEKKLKMLSEKKFFYGYSYANVAMEFFRKL